MSVGACFPKECSAEDFRWFLPHIMPLINEHIIPYQFKEVNDLDKKLRDVRLSADEVKFVDVVSENEKVTKFGFDSFLAFFICIILITLIVASTFHDWFLKSEKKKKKERLE